MTQVVPQIIAQEQARQQQELQNLAIILDALGWTSYFTMHTS